MEGHSWASLNPQVTVSNEYTWLGYTYPMAGFLFCKMSVLYCENSYQTPQSHEEEKRF